VLGPRQGELCEPLAACFPADAEAVQHGPNRRPTQDFGSLLDRHGNDQIQQPLLLGLRPFAIVPLIASAFLPSRFVCPQGCAATTTLTAEAYRPTRDLDLLARGVSDVSYRKIFSEVCSQKIEDDGLMFLPDTIRADRIRDDEVYGGVRVLLEARLGNVRVPLQIDVGLGDAIVPGPEELEYPTLLKFPAPKL
jgi:Nucleotidyl transferase AbiEii toxin, Type IV TA system